MRGQGSSQRPGGAMDMLCVSDQGGVAHASSRETLVLPALCGAALLCLPATAKAQSDSGCDNRVNDTSAKLVPCITKDDLWSHMEALQAIADANPGADGHPSRNS